MNKVEKEVANEQERLGNYDKKIIVYNYSGKTEPRYWWGICPCEKDIEKAIIYKKHKKL